MKKLLALILCLAVMTVAAACGDKKAKPADEETGIVQNHSKDTETKSEEETKGNMEIQQADDVVEITADELNEIVDEFNNTDDPEAKEALRQKLEEIFAQAEAAAEAQK